MWSRLSSLPRTQAASASLFFVSFFHDVVGILFDTKVVLRGRNTLSLLLYYCGFVLGTRSEALLFLVADYFLLG